MSETAGPMAGEYLTPCPVCKGRTSHHHACPRPALGVPTASEGSHVEALGLAHTCDDPLCHVVGFVKTLAPRIEALTPAEPDAGDVEPNAVRRIVGAWDCCGTCAGGVLASLLRKAGDERAEQIAQAIESDKSRDGWGGSGLRALNSAARIARETS